jgi:hypothetical protein
MTEVAAERPASRALARSPGREDRRRFVPAAAITGVVVALSVAYFPMYFNQVKRYDDEGSVLVAIHRFLQHGSLYDHTHGSYGPLYFTVAGFIFKVIGDPTPEKGRFVVLVITALTVMVFAATVWRVTRSVTLSVLCEVATFLVLIPYAGSSPMHPGSMIALLVAVLGYALVAHAMDPRTYWLVVSGVVVGGLLMLKVNVGLFAIVAAVVAFVIGNARFPKSFRILVGIGAVTFPFVATSQRLYLTDTAQFSVLVAFSVLALLVPLSADRVDIAPRALLTTGVAMVATVVVSCIWPLLTGTPPGQLLYGVFIQPLGQVDHLAFAIQPRIQGLGVLLTLAVLYAVIATERGGRRLVFRPPWLLDGALALAGLFVLGLGLPGGIGAWLPAIVLLPALAWLARSPGTVRLALRFLVPLSIFQLLHVYPVPGAQSTWGRVSMCVPCVIALWAGLRALPAWRSTTAWMRVIAVGSLCVLAIVGAKQWPGAAWHDYLAEKPLSLPGTGLIRVDPAQGREYRELTRVVRKHCDTFYSAPGFASLYIYTGLPSPTGQLASYPGALNAREQRDIAHQLRSLARRGKRVCIVRNVRLESTWLKSSYGKGPLGKALAPYQRRVGPPVGRWTVSREGRSAPRRVGHRRTRP